MACYQIGVFPDNFVELIPNTKPEQSSSITPVSSSVAATPQVRNSVTGASGSSTSDLSDSRSPVDSQKIAEAFIAGLAAQQIPTQTNSLSDEQKLEKAGTHVFYRKQVHRLHP